MKKIFLWTAVFVLVLFAFSFVRAAEGDVQGRYEEKGCRFNHYDGNGDLQIRSVEKPFGFPGFVLVREGKIKKVEHAAVFPAAGGATIIWFDRSGEGYVELSGKMDVVVFGIWPELSSRGKFHITEGPRGPCWEPWHEAK